VYRIVQESLTNIIKHAGSAPCDVSLAYRPASLTVVVRNETPAPAGDTGRGRADADGHGITGMRERAELLGGSLSAGRLPGGGFEVRLTLPLLARAERTTEAESVH
jgi:signal transduction histidine kinase